MASTAVTTIFGTITGWMLAGVGAAILGALVGAAFGFLAARANVRPSITMTVFIGAMAGALVGGSIVETICLPDSCVALETTAAGVSAIAAFIGVGLVAALVTRSFDEYDEHVAAGREPPGPGCEAEPQSPDTSN
jgi:hypothetical protein